MTKRFIDNWITGCLLIIWAISSMGFVKSYGQFVPIAFTSGLAIPFLVNSSAMSTTVSGSVTTKTDNTCALRGYCGSLPDPSLSGNTVVVAVSYANATTEVPTISTTLSNGSASGDTYTACASEAHDATHNHFADIFYKTNAATNTLSVTATYPAAVTNAMMIVMQFGDVAPSGFDVCAAASSASAVSTYSSGSLTPTASGDLFIEAAFTTITCQGCGTNSPAGTFVAGSQSSITWAKLASGRHSGQAVQWGIYTSTSAINPQMTTGTSNGYVAVGIAFKAASQGTAPTGLYISGMSAESTPSAGTGPFTYDFPSRGNFLALGLSCNTGIQATGITDTSGNTWILSPQNSNGSAGNPSTQMAYVNSATTSANLTLTITTSGTGDCSLWGYDISGAAAIGFSSGLQMFGDHTTTNALTLPLTWVANTSNGLTLMIGGVTNNTIINLSAPSGNVFDATTTGGQSLDGPWWPDQNNPRAHTANASTGAQTYTWTPTLTGSDAMGVWAAELINITASGGTVTSKANYINSHSVSPATGSSVTTGSFSVTGTNPVLVINVGISSSSVTVSNSTKPSWSGGATGTVTACKTITSTNTHLETWVIPAPAAGSGTVTVTLTGSAPYQVNVQLWNNADQTTGCSASDSQSKTAAAMSITPTLPTNLTIYDAVVGLGGDTSSDVAGVTPVQTYLNDTTAINMQDGWALGQNNVTTTYMSAVGSNAGLSVRLKAAVP